MAGTIADTDLGRSQCQAIWEHLQERGSITAIEALNEYGCFRCAARINDIRKDHPEVKTETVKSGGKKYARYYIEHKSDENGQMEMF